MTEQEIIDSRLIALFVADSIYKAKDINAHKYHAESFPLLHNRIVGLDLKFHCSWDWLMPVIYRCHEILCDNKTLNEKFYDDKSIEHLHYFNMFLPESIEIGWADTIGFIKWYNKNK